MVKRGRKYPELYTQTEDAEAQTKTWAKQQAMALTERWKSPPALFPWRLEIRRTEQSSLGLPSLRRSGFAQAGRLLRPRRTAFLTILRAALIPSMISSSAVLPLCQKGFSTTC